MDSSVSRKDQFWFLRVCHHVPKQLYLSLDRDYFLERVFQFMFTIIKLYGPVYSKTSNHI